MLHIVVTKNFAPPPPEKSIMSSLFEPKLFTLETKIVIAIIFEIKIIIFRKINITFDWIKGF